MFLTDHVFYCVYCFFFKQKTAYELRISDWSSDVCSSDLVARDVALHLPEGRDGYAADDVALERDEVRLRLGILRLHGGLVLLHQRDRAVPRKRHHLRDHHALAVAAQLLGQRAGADEGDVHEGGIHADPARHLDRKSTRRNSSN